MASDSIIFFTKIWKGSCRQPAKIIVVQYPKVVKTQKYVDLAVNESAQAQYNNTIKMFHAFNFKQQGKPRVFSFSKEAQTVRTNITVAGTIHCDAQGFGGVLCSPFSSQQMLHACLCNICVSVRDAALVHLACQT